MTDPTTQLSLLRAQRDAATDPALRAALDAAIAALEAAAPPEQTITNTAPNQGAQGVFYGNVYLYGQRGKPASDLIGAYLQRLVRRCGSLPLQGVYQQKSSDDVLAISLEQVYTQLATTELVERERYEGETLQAFDAEAYLKQHVGEQVLPRQQRHSVLLDAEFREGRYLVGVGPVSLDHVSAEDLVRQYQKSGMLLFYGPQLVTEAITQHQHLVLLGEPGSGKVRRMTARVIARNAPQVGAATCEVDRLTGGGNTYGTTACR